MSQDAFSRRAVVALVVVAGLSLVLALGLAVVMDPPPATSAGNDSFSRSALGHSGLVALLAEERVPVVVSRSQSGQRAGGSGTLVVAEPILEQASQHEQFTAMVQAARRVIVVLPKRHGEIDPARPAWVASSGLRDVSSGEDVLAALDLDEAKIVRPAALTLGDNDYGHIPALAQPQLVVADELTPLLASPDGILIGQLTDEDTGRRLLVIADPDLLANHGLDEGDNAALVLAAIDDFRGEGGLIWDESLHGHVAEPSLWRELGHFPLSLATLSAILALAALFWSATGRFGVPGLAPPAIAPGKQFLVDNTAALLAHGGHAASALERYHAACLADVARALHLPADRSPAEQAAHLQTLAAARELPAELDPAGLARDVAEVHSLSPAHVAARALAVALRLHRFRQEMIHGSSRHRRAPR